MYRTVDTCALNEAVQATVEAAGGRRQVRLRPHSPEAYYRAQDYSIVLRPEAVRALAALDERNAAMPEVSLLVPNGYDGLYKVFGDPRPLLEPDGSISPENELKWRRQILGTGHLPRPIPIPSGGVKSTFGAHRLLVPVFQEVFEDLLVEGLWSFVRTWGGIYNFRAVRGVPGRLSVHAWAAALDLNPETNRLGTEGDMDPRVVAVFKAHGFVWGREFKRRDPMHFQFATGV